MLSGALTHGNPMQQAGRQAAVHSGWQQAGSRRPVGLIVQRPGCSSHALLVPDVATSKHASDCCPA